MNLKVLKLEGSFKLVTMGKNKSEKMQLK